MIRDKSVTVHLAEHVTKTSYAHDIKTIEGVIRVTRDDLEGIMASALGIMDYWCRRCTVKEPALSPYAATHFARGGTLLITDDDTGKKMELDTPKLLAGITQWINESCDHYGAAKDGKLDTGKIDGPAADCIMQFALFQGLIYG